MQLYKIKDEYLRALDDLSADNSLTPEMIEDSLSLIKEEFNEKALNIGAYIKNLNADLALIKEYQASMKERKEQVENKIVKITYFLKTMMDAIKVKKIPGVEFNISLKDCPPRVVINNDTGVDEKWCRKEIIITPDKELIKKAIQAGEVVKGAHLEQGVSLVIK